MVICFLLFFDRHKQIKSQSKIYNEEDREFLGANIDVKVSNNFQVLVHD
jgi:hypothetical protein